MSGAELSAVEDAPDSSGPTGGEALVDPFRYAAFISYSSQDAAFALRVYGALESYRIPKSLGVFRLTDHPKARNRLYPCFRDREEARGGCLDEVIEGALEASNALVVVCSRDAAKSSWVDREVRYFQNLGRSDRIFAIIADHEPGAEAAGRPERECFPPSLRQRAKVILAGDARKDKDGFRHAWMKVVAGVIEVGLGALIDRDAAQRRARILLRTALAGVVATVMGVLATAWLSERARATLENRARLSADMRISFENADHGRGAAILAHLVHDMRATEQERYRHVLGSWLAQMPDGSAAINDLADGSVFTSGGRLFVKLRHRVRALPFDTGATVIVDRRGVAYALDRQGQLWWAPFGEPPSQIPLQQPLSKDVSWRLGMLDGSKLLFLGEDQIEVDEDGATTYCVTIDPASGALQSEDIYNDGEDGREYSSAACNSLLSVFGHRRSDTYPVMDAGAAPFDPVWTWTTERERMPQADFRDLPSLCGEDLYSVCGGEAFLVAPRDTQPPTLVRLSDFGDAGIADVSVCVVPQPGARPVCGTAPVRQSGIRIFDRFVYLQDHALESTQPMFRLVSRRDAGIIDFAGREARALQGADPSLVAFSPSGRQLAMVTGGDILLFDLSAARITLTARFMAPALRGGIARSGAITFAGEHHVVVARSSGLTVAYDVSSHAELWQTRLPSSSENVLIGERSNDMAAAASPDGARVAVSGDRFVVVLDAATGLPLLPLLNVDAPQPRYELVVSAEEEVLSAADPAMREAALQRWGQANLEAALPSLVSQADGSFIARRDTVSRFLLSAPPDPYRSGQTFSHARCHTGWQVSNDVVEPFDLLADVTAESDGISLSALSARCRNAPGDEFPPAP